MGHRANYVVIRKDRVKAFHDQWGALGCTLVLMRGPEEAADVNAERTDELMEWCWAEGGYLLDFDARVAIAFGEPMEDDDLLDELPPKRRAVFVAAFEALGRGPAAYLEHIAPKWAGWTLRWDERGVDAFAEHLARRRLTAQVKTQKLTAKDLPPAVEVVVPAKRKPTTTKRVSGRSRRGGSRGAQRPRRGPSPRR